MSHFQLSVVPDVLSTMVNHHETTICENIFGTFSRHRDKQIQVFPVECFLTELSRWQQNTLEFRSAPFE